jgi:hypothetical protein
MNPKDLSHKCPTKLSDSKDIVIKFSIKYAIFNAFVIERQKSHYIV